MSQQAHGTVASQPPGFSPSSRFDAVFTLSNGQRTTFTANMNVAFAAFHTGEGEATMAYDTESQLCGTQGYFGIIGVGKLRITLSPGSDMQVVFSGSIEGGPRVGTSVSGYGNWLIS